VKDEVCDSKIVNNFSRRRNTVGNNTTNVSKTAEDLLDEVSDELEHQDIQTSFALTYDIRN